jgi:hypothetical protein
MFDNISINEMHKKKLYILSEPERVPLEVVERLNSNFINNGGEKQSTTLSPPLPKFFSV